MFSYQRESFVKPFIHFPEQTELGDFVQTKLGISEGIVSASLKVLIVLSEYESQIASLQAEIKTLPAKTLCSGGLEDRSSGAMLAIHSTKFPCSFPGHSGDPKNGRGVRRYVRKTDVEKVQKAQARYAERERLMRELDALRHSYQVLLGQLNETANIADCAVLKS